MKIILNYLIVSVFMFLLTSCAKSKHKIGDIYKGGYIFKINMFGHGLCAAPSDYPKPMQWGVDGVLIDGANGKKIGTGKQNTEEIIAGTDFNGLYAAKVCDELIVDEYEDWYLPSLEELLLMHRELYAQSMGDFKPSEYWSSTQDYALGAWKVDFATGEKGNDSNKASKGMRVRAIRSF